MRSPLAGRVFIGGAVANFVPHSGQQSELARKSYPHAGHNPAACRRRFARRASTSHSAGSIAHARVTAHNGAATARPRATADAGGPTVIGADQNPIRAALEFSGATFRYSPPASAFPSFQ